MCEHGSEGETGCGRVSKRDSETRVIGMRVPCVSRVIDDSQFPCRPT
jgi:hypothetical protein